jgi:hypothetical protein
MVGGNFEGILYEGEIFTGQPCHALNEGNAQKPGTEP